MSRIIARFSAPVVAARAPHGAGRSWPPGTQRGSPPPAARRPADRRQRPHPPAGGAEGSEGGRTQRELGLGAREELGVLRIGPRPPALDETDPEVIQMPRDGQLVSDRKRQPLLLSAVAQGGVVDVKRLRVIRVRGQQERAGASSRGRRVRESRHHPMLSRPATTLLRRDLSPTPRRNDAAGQRPEW